jgi:hypothetical protein
MNTVVQVRRVGILIKTEVAAGGSDRRLAVTRSTQAIGTKALLCSQNRDFIIHSEPASFLANWCRMNRNLRILKA